MGARKSISGRGLRPNHPDPRKGSGDGAITVAKIGLISTLLAALIAGVVTVSVALINGEPSHTTVGLSPAVGGTPAGVRMPQPTCATCTPGGKTFTEQVHTSNPAGTTAFRDPRGFKGQGPPVPPGQRVGVVCRFLDSNAPASVQPGWWYLVDSPPWNRQYYTPANSYLNGDPPEGPYLTDVDGRVPLC